jgi:hypothetical protein
MKSCFAQTGWAALQTLERPVAMCAGSNLGTTMTSKWTRTISFATCISAAACDAQHDLDYTGQAVWTLLGSIVSRDARIDEDTSAAIYWSNAGRHLDVLEEVEVEGDFPAEFTLRAYEPPPATARVSLAEVGIAALEIAVGVVVAVEKESAPFHPVVIGTTEEPDIGALAPGETLLEGDNRAWLRGGAPGHLVVYLDAEPPESAVCLADFTAGYNLVALTPRTSAEVASKNACTQQAFDAALAAYNAEQGTLFTEDDLFNDERAQDEVSRAAARLECESGCDLFKLKGTAVPPDSRVTLEMQANPELVDWF